MTTSMRHRSCMQAVHCIKRTVGGGHFAEVCGVLAYRSFDQRPVSRGNLGASGMTIRTPIEDALFSVNGCVRCAGRPPSAGRNPMSSTGAGLAGTQSQSTVSPPNPRCTHARTTHRTPAPTLCRASQIGPKIGSHFSSSSTGAGHCPWPHRRYRSTHRKRSRAECARGSGFATDPGYGDAGAAGAAGQWPSRCRPQDERTSGGPSGHAAGKAIASTVCACGNVVLAGLTARRMYYCPTVVSLSTAVKRARRQHATRDVAASNAASDAGLSAHSEAPRAAAPTDGARGRPGTAVRCSAVCVHDETDTVE